MDKEQELNEYLAEEIMRWEYLGCHSEQGEESKAWYKTDNRKRTHWNPLTNLEQTFVVLEEYCFCRDYIYELNGIFEKSFECILLYQYENYHDFNYQAETKPEAIIGAILKAEGVYEDYKECFE